MMPPTKGETHESKAVMARKRMHEELYKATWNRVVGALKHNETALYNTERQLIDDGFVQPMELTTTPSKSKLLSICDGPSDKTTTNSGAAAAPTAAVGVAASVASSTDGDALLDWDDTPFSRNKTTFDDLGPRILEELLEMISPIAMSRGNLNNLRERGQRVVTNDKLWQLLEYGCNIQPSDPIEPIYRSKRGVGQYVKQKYLHSGEGRLHNVPLPINFEAPYAHGRLVY